MKPSKIVWATAGGIAIVAIATHTQLIQKVLGMFKSSTQGGQQEPRPAGWWDYYADWWNEKQFEDYLKDLWYGGKAQQGIFMNDGASFRYPYGDIGAPIPTDDEPENGYQGGPMMGGGPR